MWAKNIKWFQFQNEIEIQAVTTERRHLENQNQKEE